MEITERIETRKDVKAIAVRLVGNYCQMDYKAAWDKLGEYCRKHHLDFDCPDAEYINVYHDNPVTTPTGECRADVCIAASVMAKSILSRFMAVASWCIVTKDPTISWVR